MKMIFEYHSQSQFKRALKESTHDFTKWKTTIKTVKYIHGCILL